MPIFDDDAVALMCELSGMPADACLQVLHEEWDESDFIEE
jgi:hypothetical protein